MPKKLTSEQVEQYRRDGYVSPVTIMTPEEAFEVRNRLEAFERAQGRPLYGRQKTKCFMLFPWMHRLVTAPALLDAVEDLIGPDILIYQNGAWLKEPRDETYVSWHQDSTYYGLDPAVLVTAWVALSPSRAESGCVRVLPGTHTLGQLPVDYSELKETNLLSSGQRTRHDFPDSMGVDLELEPGQASFHHIYLIHNSGPNMSGDRRAGFSIAFIPPSVGQTGKRRATAFLARGEDRYGHFRLETPPVAETDPDTAARHAESVELYRLSAREKGNESVNRLD